MQPCWNEAKARAQGTKSKVKSTRWSSRQRWDAKERSKRQRRYSGIASGPIVQAQAAENNKTQKTAKAKPNKQHPHHHQRQQAENYVHGSRGRQSQYMNDSNQHQLESEIRHRRQSKSGQQSCDALHRTIY